MIKLFNVLMSPIFSGSYVPNKKCIDPITAGAGISALGGVANTVLSGIFGNAANKANIRMQRETNAQNYQMFKEQQAYNLDMWNKQNEYNLPANQVQRLLAAGINPSAVFGSGSVTPAGEINTGNPPNMVAPRVQNPLPNPNLGVGDAANAYFQNQLLNANSDKASADAAISRINAEYRATEIVSNLYEQMSRVSKNLQDVKVGSAQYGLLLRQKEDLQNRINLFNDTREELVRREKLQNDVMKNQAENLLADSTLKRAQTQYQNIVMMLYPKITSAQLNVMSAQFSDLMQSVQLKIKTGQLTDLQSIQQELETDITRHTLRDVQVKHGHHGGNPEALSKIKDMSTYIAGLLLDNLRLFK